jgi:Flp pilus assembly pilin Flp
MPFLISYLASRSYVALRKQGGQALVEYAIILILVSVVCVVVLATQGVTLQHMFSNVTCGFGHCPAPVEPTPIPTPPCGDDCRPTPG